MEIEDLAALFAGVAALPVAWQIWAFVDPKVREAPPEDPGDRIVKHLLLAVVTAIGGALQFRTPVDLFFAGLGSYALADSLITADKLIYTPAAVAVPPPVNAQGSYLIT